MIFAISFCAGVLLLLALPSLPAAWIAAVVAAAAAGFGLLIRRQFVVAPAVCAVCAGFVFAWAQAHEYLQLRWPVDRADDRVIARVIVDTIPVARDSAWLFDGIAEVEAPQRLQEPLRVRLVWRDAPVRPQAGERWQLLLSLRPPRGRVNPGTVDLERELFQGRIHALGAVVPSRLNVRMDSGHRPLAAFRERIARHIDARVVDRDAAALISALAVGVTGAMSREQWRVFNATGTTHLVAISGLHVTLFAVIAFAAARRLWSLALWRWVRWPRENFAAAVGFFAAATYATLAGLSVPTQRTLIMLGVWLLARSLARVSAPFHPFAVALLAVLLLDPFAPLAAGFWLSFGAMAAIILVTSSRFVRRTFVHEALAVQSVVIIALTPVTLASFGSVSVIGPLVNGVAIPAMSWIFVPTILFSIALAPLWQSLSNALLGAAAWMHDAAWPWLAAASDLPWALAHACPSRWWYLAAAVSVFVSLMPLPRMLRVAALVWIVPLALAAGARPKMGGVEMTILDVGEATSIVVHTSNHVLVYELGEGYGSDGRTVESVLVPFLRSRGARSIDALVVSRLTPSVSPAVTALLAEMPIRETLIGEGAHADFEGARSCASVGAWRWDQVTFRLLQPASDESSPAQSRVCTLSIETPRGRMLIPGDLDADAERGLVAANDLAAAVVVVPRQGSDAASSPEFVRAVNARWAVVSRRRTRQGGDKHALGRWQQHGTRVLVTAEQGATGFAIDPRTGLAGPSARRAESRTLWRSSP